MMFLGMLAKTVLIFHKKTQLWIRIEFSIQLNAFFCKKVGRLYFFYKNYHQIAVVRISYDAE